MSFEQKNFVIRLLGQHGNALTRYLTARVRNASDAQDIAQETYLRLLRFDRIDLIRDPQAYLFRVAANIAREYQLKRSREPLDTRSVKDMSWSDGDALEEIVDRNAQLAKIDRALARLEPSYRAVLLLHRRDGMTYEEIAKELGISFHTVKKYLGIALAACREALPHNQGTP